MLFLAQQALPITCYCLTIAVALLTCLILLSRRAHKPLSYILAWLAYGAIALSAAPFWAADPFSMINLLCMAIFLGGPVLLALSATLALRQKLRVLAGLAMGTGFLLVVCGLDAFLWEPGALAVDEVEIVSAKIHSPIKIAVLSDIQTDRVGDYERNALKRALEVKPDLILFPGDFIQCLNEEEQRKQEKALNNIFRELNIDAPLGCFAVSGNVEVGNWHWQDIFAGTKIKPIADTQTMLIGEIALTGLSFKDSFSRNLVIGPEHLYHIVFGHGPDFALAAPEGDLYIAGHTHDGQVQIPGYGPILTLSAVPTVWGGGVKSSADVREIKPGKTLLVSRGIGMERGYAPRLRFFCRPQVLIVNVKPSGSPT